MNPSLCHITARRRPRAAHLAAPLATFLASLVAALGVGAFLPTAARADQPPAPTPAMDEIVVTGERTGPGMWHVHRGGAHLWILGSMSPLPKGITWRSKQVEQVLDGTSQVLVQKPLDVGIVRILWLLITERDVLMLRGGKRLHDVLPANLYERFSRQRAKFTDDPKKWERFRPLIAAAFLQQDAFHQVGLSMRLDLGAAMRNLAKQHHVRVEEIKVAGVGDALDALKSMPPAAENACVEASLATIESGLPRLIDRAQAWATGNLERLAQLPEPAEVDACRAALDSARGAADVIARIRQSWLGELDKYLQHDGVTIAVINMDMMLERGGLLDELRSQGYEVDAP